jgi:hypothetical protein
MKKSCLSFSMTRRLSENERFFARSRKASRFSGINRKNTLKYFED